MKMKKAQITLFIILAIILVSSVMIIFYLQSESDQINVQKQGNLDQSDIDIVNAHISSCLKSTLEDSISNSGLDEDSIGEYIEENLETCINFSVFKNLGIIVESGSINSLVHLSNTSVSVSLDYLIVIKKESLTSKLDSFYAESRIN